VHNAAGSSHLGVHYAIQNINSVKTPLLVLTTSTSMRGQSLSTMAMHICTRQWERKETLTLTSLI
jgi:hypothetical protein